MLGWFIFFKRTSSLLCLCLLAITCFMAIFLFWWVRPRKTRPVEPSERSFTIRYLQLSDYSSLRILLFLSFAAPDCFN